MDYWCVRFKACRPESGSGRTAAQTLAFAAAHFSGFGGGVSRLPGRLGGGLLGQPQRLQTCHLFANDAAIGLVLRHRLGAFFGALFLLEICLGTRLDLTRPGFTRSCCQCLLLLRGERAIQPPAFLQKTPAEAILTLYMSRDWEAPLSRMSLTGRITRELLVFDPLQDDRIGPRPAHLALTRVCPGIRGKARPRAEIRIVSCRTDVPSRPAHS